MTMNRKDLLELIKTGEGYTLEVKETLNSSISREICAFANASGGKIILGVKDNGEIAGFNLTNAINSRIQDTVRNIDPALSIAVEKVSNLAIIYVPEGKEKPYFAQGHCYLRQGANSQQLRRDDIRAFFQRENLIQFDRKAYPGFEENDFDKNAFGSFIAKAGIDKTLPKEHILKSLGLITEEKINNAGVLFFSKSISKYFLNAVIGCVLYDGKTKTRILDKKEFDSDFISNLNSSVIFVLRNLRIEYIIEKIEREEKPEIPEAVLRELIINAMSHRDYFSNGRVLIEIFSDRVEISNPGGLLFDKSELGKRSLARNPLLVDMVLRRGLVEKVGSGITRVRVSLKDRVKFEILPDWFRVIIIRRAPEKARKIKGKIVELIKKNPSITTSELAERVGSKLVERVGSKLAESQLKILLLIEDTSSITKRELSGILRISTTAIDKNISKLKELHLIKRVGPDKGGHWEIVKLGR